MNRRTVLKGGVVLAATSHTAVSVAEMPDRSILDLGLAFDAAYAEEEAARIVCRDTGDWSTWDAAYATTLEGLRVKARCIQWCHGDDPVDLALSDTTDGRLATQVVQALLKI